MKLALVIGAGPAGLMAAEEMADAGLAVTVAEAKPTIGRKLLMAGKSGLNLTKDEPLEDFLAAYGEATPHLSPMLAEFGPCEVRRWAEDLGQKVFTGSSGRVFPEVMKASPLLRNWRARLIEKGVTFHMRWRWRGFADSGLAFDTPEGARILSPSATVLALGGASWPRLGSDGAWAEWLAEKGVPITPFKPANMGFVVNWSRHMEGHFGRPVKNVALIAGGVRVRGEFVISKRGIEGGGVYAVSRALREGASLTLDLLPDVSAEEAEARLSRPQGKESLSNTLRKRLRLDPVKIALMRESMHPLPTGPALAALAKALPVPLAGPYPLEEAISTAGGIAFSGLDGGLGIRALPGIFAAGEMLDWEAPTGGYLLTACLSTGRWAGRAAARSPW